MLALMRGRAPYGAKWSAVLFSSFLLGYCTNGSLLPTWNPKTCLCFGWISQLSKCCMYYKFKLVTDNLPLHLCRSQVRSHWKFNSFPGVAQNLFHLCISYNKILVGHVCSHYLNCMTSIRAVAINTVTRIVIHVFSCIGKRSVVRCWQVNIHGRPQVSQHRWLWR